MPIPRRFKAYKYLATVIQSCETREQLESCYTMINNYCRIYGQASTNLLVILDLQKIAMGVFNENED